MDLPQDARFVSERRRFALRFTCEHCALWDEPRDACAHGYPTAPHRAARLNAPAAPVTFCKDFHLS